MPRNGVRKQDRSTLYGVFAILALLPTAFSVAFEFSARGIASVEPWLMAWWPLALLVAARFIPSVRRRGDALVLVPVAVALMAAGWFCWHLFELLGYLGVTGAVRWVTPVVIAVMYGAFGVFMGHLRNRTSTSSHRYDNGLHGSGSARAVVARERVRQ